MVVGREIIDADRASAQAVLRLNKRALHYSYKKYEFPVDLTSTLPFWLVKNGLRKIYPSIPDEQTTDFVVGGAGVTGAMIAQRLAEGGFSVVVVDQRDVCTLSTSASTALLQYEIDVSLVRLATDRKSVKLLANEARAQDETFQH